jgi:hypothetical protein
MPDLLLPLGVPIVVVIVGAIVFVYLNRRFPATVDPHAGRRVTVAEGAGGVVVRRYVSVADFQTDAALMAAAGWYPVTQSETSAGLNGAWVGVAVILGLIGLLVYWLILIVSILVLILAAVNGRKALIVSYQPRT